MSNALALVSKAERLLAEAKTPEALNAVWEMADLAEHAAKLWGLNAEAVNHCLEIKALAGQKLGEHDTAPHGGAHEQGSNLNLALFRRFNRRLRSDWKALAKVPEKKIRAAVHEATQDERKLSWYSLVLTVRGRQQQAAAAERAKNVTPLPSELRHQDFREATTPEDSVDLIFTDPPYSPVFKDLYADLSAFAYRVLRPGGICAAYSGQLALAENFMALSEHLEPMWMAAVRHTGGEMRFRKYSIRNGWKPVLIFYKDPLEVWWDWFSDVVSGGKEKDSHPWQQAEAEAEHFIAALCPSGGVVIDPMCGSGTTLVAAKKLGRRYLGFDIDGEALSEATRRLAE